MLWKLRRRYVLPNLGDPEKVIAGLPGIAFQRRALRRTVKRTVDADRSKEGKLCVFLERFRREFFLARILAMINHSFPAWVSPCAGAEADLRWNFRGSVEMEE